MRRGHVDDEVRFLFRGIQRRRDGISGSGRIHHAQVRGPHLRPRHGGDLDAHGGPAEPRGHGGKLRGGDQPGVDERGGEHVARHAGDALEKQDPAHRGAPAASRTARTTWHAAKPAENPLSMLVTVTPGAQQLSIASSALRPPKLAP